MLTRRLEFHAATRQKGAIVGQHPRLTKEPHAEYDAKRAEFLTATAVKDFIKSPAIYAARMAGELPFRSSRAMDVGTAAHVLILEGLNAYTERYVVSSGPVNDKTGKPYGTSTKAYQEWKDGMLSQGLELITPGEDQTVREMAASVRLHPVASEWLASGEPEGVVRTRVMDMDVQARLDFYAHDGYIVDLKTCRDLDAFEDQYTDLRYDIQAAFYQEVFEAAYYYAPPVRFVAVEKAAPFRVGVFEVPDAEMGRARAELVRTLLEIKRMDADGVYPTRYDGVIQLGGTK